MANINLLPENFRQKEDKEIKKAAQRPKIFEVELMQPARGKFKELSSATSGSSWWEKIFGVRQKSESLPISMPEPSRIRSSSNLYLLASARKERVDIRPVRQEKIKKMSKAGVGWFTIFKKKNDKPVPVLSGQAIRPAEPSKDFIASNKSVVAPLLRPQEAVSKPILKPIPIPKPNIIKPFLIQKEIKKKTERADSWWHIFRSMFVRGPKNIALPKMPMASKPVPDKISSRPSSSAKTPVDKSAAYHLAPKVGKSKFNINLIPEELIFSKEINFKLQVAAVILAIVLPGLFIYGAYYLISVYQKQVDQQILIQSEKARQLNNIVKSYQQIKEQTVISQQKLLTLKGLLDNHIYWTKFFGLLEKYTLDGVYFSDFTADTGGDIILPGVADNYETIARQIVALKQAPDFVSDVKMEKAMIQSDKRAGVTGIAFELKIKLADKVFIK